MTTGYGITFRTWRAGFAGLLAFLFLGCAGPAKRVSTTSHLPASLLQPFGRTSFDNGSLSLVSSASGFGFRFDGTTCGIIASVPASLDHNYLQYEIDGVYQKRLRISSKSGEPVILRANSGGRHAVWIYKATEAHTGSVLVKGVDGQNVTALKRPQAKLIEFIGNSITCGAASDASEVPCGTGAYHDQHNAYMAYGPRVARALGADFRLSCVSGIGMYRNWNSDGPAMPQVYTKLDFQPGASPDWDFSTFTPDLVSIALGTNDFSRGDGQHSRQSFDSAKFVDAYIRFVGLVRSKYPAAKIVLLSSPMVNGEARVQFQHYLEAVKGIVDAAHSSAKPLALFFFKPMQASGCSGHPSVAEHGVMAEELLPYFRSLL